MRSSKKIDMLEAITPIDGRYRDRLAECSDYFSEYALIRRRFHVELVYLEELARQNRELVSKLPDGWAERLRKIGYDFDFGEAEKVKTLESSIGHDVVAVTEYLAERLRSHGLEPLIPYIHLGLTSEDINNLAQSTILRDFIRGPYLRETGMLLEKLVKLAREHRGTPMLARTHGQPAAPTTFGRFLAGYAYRVGRLATQIADMVWYGKIGGAVGDLNALTLAYPEMDTERLVSAVLERVGLRFFPASTQILPNDPHSENIFVVAVLSSVLSNMARDFWLLGMLGYLRFEKVGELVHSSAMPQKNNPIHLENAEGSLDMASEMLSYISRRLISSRLHRDLSDSVVRRFYGVALPTAYLGLKSLVRALDSVRVDAEMMRHDLEMHPEADAERLQVLLRRHGQSDGYELARRALEKGLGWLSEELERRGLDAAVREEILSVRMEEYLRASMESVDRLLADVEKFIETIRGQMR
ncbi:Adenylosuccinate lyase [archaeon HR01]|nr:Adenylosuccinate lyase [archaeon HR01]